MKRKWPGHNRHNVDTFNFENFVEIFFKIFFLLKVVVIVEVYKKYIMRLVIQVSVTMGNRPLADEIMLLHH